MQCQECFLQEGMHLDGRAGARSTDERKVYPGVARVDHLRRPGTLVSHARMHAQQRAPPLQWQQAVVPRRVHCEHTAAPVQRACGRRASPGLNVLGASAGSPMRDSTLAGLGRLPRSTPCSMSLLE